MAGLFDNLADFFAGLFNSDPEAQRLKKRMKQALDELAAWRPAVYQAKTDEVLPGFIQSWGQVHVLLQPLRDVFDRTLSHPDLKVSEASLAFVLESVLSGDVGERRQAFTYEAVHERLTRSEDPGQELKTVTAQFNSLVSDLKRQDTEALQHDLDGLFRLKQMAGHNLFPLLTKFGYDGGAKGQKYRSLSGDAVLTDLLDLYYVVQGLVLSPEVEGLVGLLLERLSAQKAADNRKKMAQLFTKLRELNRGGASASLLLQLIRVIQKDPDALPEGTKAGERHLQAYLNALSDRFNRDRERAQREQSESSVEADLAALFAGAALLPLKFYSADTSLKLSGAGLPDLNAVKPLQILRSFCFTVLKAGYLDNVKKVVVNGVFLDKDWGEALSDALYAAEDTLNRVEAFDLAVETDAKFGLPAFEKYLSGSVPASSVARALVEKLNKQAQALVEQQAGVLLGLAQKVQDLLNDAKAPQPHRVGNLKVLGGKDQRAILEGLITGYNKTGQLLRILKHFIVVK